ncbi:MAG TPA: NADH-quinone oxidoreductase subunit J [Gemmatimonadaceae bacterium]|nr:NADH-quinone oxidoreductase subunit J [Gemmatimonadaceae bacterium]
MSHFFYSFHFYLFGILALASSIVFVTRKSPVAAALWLVNTMFCLAALYVMLEAHFIGIIQVLVYAGAIMVVFLFVVMLLNLGHPSDLADARGKVPTIVAAGLGLALLALIGVTLRFQMPGTLDTTARAMHAQEAQVGAVGAVAEPLFREYLLAFEVTSLVLLVAMIGAVVLGKRRTA